MASSSREKTQHDPSFQALKESEQRPVPTQMPSLYHDHSFSVPTSVESASENQGRERFPDKLFRVLDRAATERFDHVISWQHHGRCFMIHQRETFKALLTVLMPGITRWKSFQRQLHVWGFTRLNGGRDANGYYHELFLRCRPHLLRHMQRSGYGDRTRILDNDETRPNFYTMPFLARITVTRADQATLRRHSPESVDILSISEARALLDQSVTISFSGHHADGSIFDLGRESGNVGASQSLPPELNTAAEGDVGAATSENEEATAIRTATVASVGDLMIHRDIQPNHSRNHSTELNQELEPRPLPPVVTRVGESIIHSYTPVPVAQHPGFTQVGPREFLYNARQSSRGEEEFRVI
jgi:HSF-type DNA-binding